MDFMRYALFYTPPPGALAQFGARWLGWDATTGQGVSPPAIDSLPMPWEEITARPRNYGLHGTLKPPFRLAAGATRADLCAALEAFSARHHAVVLDRLELAQLGRFLALVPSADSPALNALAAATVEEFDRFRAPLNNAELARRRKTPLTAEQDALLLRWGYPYVMQAFRFHITLSDKLPKAKTTALRSVLEPILTPLVPAPFVIDALSLLGEDENGMFHLVQRTELKG